MKEKKNPFTREEEHILQLVNASAQFFQTEKESVRLLKEARGIAKKINFDLLTN